MVPQDVPGAAHLELRLVGYRCSQRQGPVGSHLTPPSPQPQVCRRCRRQETAPEKFREADPRGTSRGPNTPTAKDSLALAGRDHPPAKS